MSNYSTNQLPDDPLHVWNRIIGFIPEGSKVLDIGCSSGNLGEHLIRTKKCIVDGIEIDEQDAGLARKKLRNVKVLDVQETTAVDKVDDKYDVIIFADVLEHLLDPSQVLVNVKRLLVPGGKIVFSVPNMAHVSIRLALLRGEFKHTETGILDKTHLHFYDGEEIKRVFHDAKMSLITLDSSPYPYSRDLINNILQEVGLKPSSKTYEILEAPDAIAFQYVGEANYQQNLKTKFIGRSLSQPIQNDVMMLTAAIKARDKVIARLNETALELSSDLKKLNQTIVDIRSSKSYKLSRAISAPLSSTKNTVKKVMNKRNKN